MIPGAASETRFLPNGDRLDVLPMIFTAKLTFTFADNPYPEFGFDGCWCYPTVGDALAAQAAWDGEGDPPVGWIREPRSGRRRPDGDPDREYVNP